MTKPDWNNAPKWANWLAMDEDGDWYWYEDKPQHLSIGVWYSSPGKVEFAESSITQDWKETMERRQ